MSNIDELVTVTDGLNGGRQSKSDRVSFSFRGHCVGVKEPELITLGSVEDEQSTREKVDRA